MPYTASRHCHQCNLRSGLQGVLFTDTGKCGPMRGSWRTLVTHPLQYLEMQAHQPFRFQSLCILLICPACSNRQHF